MKPTILDFHIRPIAPDRYSVEVFVRGASHPLAASTFDYRLSSLTEYGIDRLDFDPKDPNGRIERLRKFGSQLYQKLFSPEIQKAWQEEKGRNDFLTLCLRIAPEASGLEVLPWETLFDGEEFLAAGAKTGVSRLPLDIEPQNDLPPIPLPIRMLAVASSPLDLPDQSRLQFEREQEILLEAVNTPAGQGRLHIDFEDEAKLEILESSLESGYHVLHFTGHGIPPADGGGLLLEDAEGKRRPAGVNEVLQSLEKGISALRLAVISAPLTARTLHTGSFSDLARGLARRRVPAVLAMQFSISDVGGLKLAESLYPKLIEGQPLEKTLSDARRAMLISDDPILQADALAPVLITANGQCLMAAAAATSATAKPNLDPSFYLATLPQLGFGFYGRRREYRQIRDGLLQRNQHAVIIYGIGGIGKSALASHTAARLRKRFKGVYAFDCSVGELAPERIILELHRYFERQGVQVLQPYVHQPLEPEALANILAQLLKQWPLLVIFDSFEAQIERADNSFRIADKNLRAFLITLIKATDTGSRFLFTSRYLFDLDDGRLGIVQSLPLHDLSRAEAMMLMLKLPNLAQSHYFQKRLIYQAFGGHPYAMVLMDRYCHKKPVSAALNDAKALHGKLREFLAIELIYGQLNERSRELLNRFAAFRRPEPLEAAEWVMSDKVQFDNRDLLKLDRNTLPEEWKSLDDATLIKILNLHSPERRQPINLDQPIRELIDRGMFIPFYQDDEPKLLTVHALVRDFCRDKQRHENWRLRLRDAAAFYSNSAMPKDSKSPAAVWSEMEAFELLMEAEEFAEAAKLLVDAHQLLDRWGFGRYVESQYYRLRDKVDGLDEAIVSHNLGVLLQSRGDYDAALDHYQRSLKIAEEIGDIAGVASSLHQIGTLDQARGDYDAALDHYQRSLKILEELGDVAGVARLLHNIGALDQARGDYDAALDHYQRSLKILEELGDVAGVARSLHNIGALDQARGNYDAALDHYQQSLKIAEEIGDIAGVASSLHQIGTLDQARGDYDAALDHYQRSLKIAEKLGDVAGVARLLHNIGALDQARGDYDAALDHYQRSLKIAEELGNVAGVARSLHNIGALDQRRLLESINEILVSQRDNKVIKKEPGSTKLTIELTSEQAEQLIWLYKQGVLDDLGIKNAKVLGNSAAAALVKQKANANNFDVFLCHNSEDKPEVMRIALKLRRAGILPWLDVWELRPGMPWQRVLEQHLETINAAAVFVGDSGIGPWQSIEIEAFLRQFVQRQCPVIPVILKSCQNIPKLPIFLDGMTWVDFTKRNPDPHDRLIWGITGKKPN